ncbi:MAG: hypothetical protein ABSC47_06960 [Terracidiphilus sp.]|jgi:hypothetical protein
MTPDGRDFRERLTEALSMPESAHRFLYVYWLAATKWLKRSDEESTIPQLPPLIGEGIPEWVRSSEETIAKREMLIERLRRIEGYLGHAPRKINPKTLEDAKCLEAVKWIRATTREGWPEERIASWLSNYLWPRARAKRGRQAGTVDLDGHAVMALTLHGRDPKLWSYPKLADQLLGCKRHKQHTADSDCVDKLKKAVARLRTFLQELGFKPAGK